MLSKHEITQLHIIAFLSIWYNAKNNISTKESQILNELYANFIETANTMMNKNSLYGSKFAIFDIKKKQWSKFDRNELFCKK